MTFIIVNWPWTFLIVLRAWPSFLSYWPWRLRSSLTMKISTHHNPLQPTVTHSNPTYFRPVQPSVTHCNPLQPTVAHPNPTYYCLLKPIAAYWNPLQPALTHCNPRESSVTYWAYSGNIWIIAKEHHIVLTFLFLKIVQSNQTVVSGLLALRLKDNLNGKVQVN